MIAEFQTARKVALGAALVAGTSMMATTAVAQVSETFSASIELASEFTVTEVTPIAFGQIARTGTVSATSTIRVEPEGGAMTLGAGGGWLVVQDGTPGQLQVSGAAPNTLLTVALATGPFSLSQFGVADELVVGALGLDGSPTTDANGDLTLNFGLTLTPEDTDTDTNFTFDDGVYSGTFDIEFSY